MIRHGPTVEPRHKSFTDEHAADEPAMKEESQDKIGRGSPDVGKGPSGRAQIFGNALIYLNKCRRSTVPSQSPVLGRLAGTGSIQAAFMFSRLSKEGPWQSCPQGRDLMKVGFPLQRSYAGCGGADSHVGDAVT
jgi:hypothetical protein